MKKAGILGGMGPLATVDLFAKIVECTPAEVDQDHLRIIIDNNPHIPPRVAAIEGSGDSPLPAMIESARLLANAGADFIVMPCNTAHYWLDGLRAGVNIPVYSMIDNAVEYVASNHSSLSGQMLLLATGATVRLKLYQNVFAAKNISVQVLKADEQEMLDAAIRDIKRGKLEGSLLIRRVDEVLSDYAANGIKAIFAGCTEVPIMMPYLKVGIERFDATRLLAEMVVRVAKEDS